MFWKYAVNLQENAPAEVSILNSAQYISYAQAVCRRATKEETDAFKENDVINVEQLVKIIIIWLYYSIGWKDNQNIKTTKNHSD